MKRSLRVGLAAVAISAVGGSYYTFLVPKIGHASRNEIEAVLPSSLKVSEVPDPAAQERYRRLIKLIEKLDPKPIRMSGGALGVSTAANERVLGQIAALVKEGPLRKPLREQGALFTDLAPTKEVAKLMALAAETAWKRGDRRACAHWVTSGLRYADALMNSGGAVIDGLVGIAVQAIAVRIAYRAEIENGLDSAGRTQVLALLPEGNGASPALARTVRGEFCEFLLPVILDPLAHKDSLVSEFTPFSAPLEDEETTPPPPLFGTFDPVETAREAGRVYDARIANLQRPFLQETHADEAIAERIAHGLPQPPQSSDDQPSLEGWPGLRFRMAMNAGRNTLGRSAASSAVFVGLGGAAARLDASRNLARAVILLRMGQVPKVFDPFSGKPLQIDRKRKIVWSVNTNGKDDGGQIGRGGDNLSPDLGYPYSDHSFHPNPNGPFRREPPGMPPPP